MSGVESATALRAREARQRRFGLVFAFVWLLYLTSPLQRLVTTSHPLWQRVVGIGLTVAFAAIYMTALAGAFRRLDCERRLVSLTVVRLLPLTLLVMSAAMFPLVPEDIGTYLVFTIFAMIMLWPVWLSVPVSAGAVALTAYLLAALDHRPLSGSDAFIMAIMVPLGLAMRYMRNQGFEVERTRKELARLALVEERARFARDLHDILGHSLTTITVKAALAGRLIPRDPERGRQEVAEIEQLARAALDDVRRTVAGYRGVTLAGELVAARAVLTAAGIHPDLPHAVDGVPGQLRELFGWVVREGVTNVVRHSRARTCVIRLSPTCVEIVDDGRGDAPGTTTAGHGLAGLRERVAAAGGRVEAGPLDGQGFRLRVEVPARRPE